MIKLSFISDQYKKLLKFYQNIVPKVALLTFLVSALAISILFFTFDYVIEKDIKKIQLRKITSEFDRLSLYIKGQQSQLLLLAHTAFRDTEVNHVINNSTNRYELDRWAKRYISMNSKLHELDSLTVWSYDGGLIGSTDHIIGNMTLNLTNYSILDAKFPQAGILKLGDELWVVSITPIMNDGFKMGTVQFSRNISNKFKNEISLISNLSLTTSDQNISYDADNEFVLANTIDGKQIYIEPDSFHKFYIDNNSRIYAISIMFLTSIILFVIFVSILKRETLPLKKIETLLKGVNQSTFSPSKIDNCCTEVNIMYKAYRDILVKLQFIKEQEVILSQKNKLVSIGKLASRVSHDINNPLSIIRSLSDIGRQQGYSLDNHVLQDMDKIYQQTDRCMKMSNNLLNIHTKTQVPLDDLNLANIALKFVESQPAELQDKIKLIDLSGEFLVSANYDLCEHILEILINNSFQANNNSDITIKTFKTPNWGVVEITDKGVGFPLDSEKEIFELFFTTKSYGKGIGLSNALSLANSMSGTLQITDAPLGQISLFLKSAENI